MKRHRHGIAALVLAAVLALTQIVQPAVQAGAATLAELQQEQKRLEQEKKESESKLASLKADQSKQQEYKNALDEQVNNLQNQIDGLNAQINSLDASIEEKDAAIAEKQKNIDEDIETLKERLCAIYMMGQKEEVASARADLEGRRRELAEVQAEADRVLAELNESVASVQAESEAIAKKKAEADKAVDDWLEDYYASQKPSTGGGSSSGSGGYTSTGNFTWPVPGFTRLTTRFQEWTYGGYHRGIDIASTGGRSIYGAPIVAADSGRVIKAGWNNSYGNCVYIDHGGGYVTRYAHASSLAVTQGQTVTKGQTIAYVGNTGDSFGAHLHFEVILNGTLKNPMSYFS